MPLFADIVGQDLALAILRRALVTEAAHAYLFAGPLGVGKSEAAVEFAAGLICADGGCGDCDACRRVRDGIHPDVETVAPEGTNILIDQVRAVNEDVVLRPFEATVRVYIVLAAETMNKEAANAVLKTLEEPPPHAHFILVSSYPEQLLPTIVSRCQRVPFGPHAGSRDRAIPDGALRCVHQRSHGLRPRGPGQLGLRQGAGDERLGSPMARPPDRLGQGDTRHLRYDVQIDA